MRIELSSPEAEGWQHWLVVRQSIASGDKPPNQAFFLVFAPTGAPLSEMIRVIGERWRIEQCFEVGKGEVGLDDYEVRSWHGWYRHVTLCLLAQAFLTILRLRCEGNESHHDGENEENTETEGPTQPLKSVKQPQSQADLDLPMMVPLSIPEVRRIFYYLVGATPFSCLYHLAWSYWRRTHQAIARLCHYKRRMAAQL